MYSFFFIKILLISFSKYTRKTQHNNELKNFNGMEHVPLFWPKYLQLITNIKKLKQILALDKITLQHEKNNT